MEESPWAPNKIAAGVATSLIAAALIAVGVWVYNARTSDGGASGLVGGYEPFTVFAQNRWDPLGTSVRAEPFGTAEKAGSFAPNELIAVDGWVRIRSPYPSNTSPWNSDAWFHLADNSGWVSFAGVRADPTTPDETGGFSEDGGRPVPLSDDCSGTLR